MAAFFLFGLGIDWAGREQGWSSSARNTKPTEELSIALYSGYM